MTGEHQFDGQPNINSNQIDFLVPPIVTVMKFRYTKILGVEFTIHLIYNIPY